MEPCIGCGVMSDAHPYVGVTRDQETGAMAAFPVCAACWADPAHRQVVLKMHFFARGQAADAVDAAERNILVTPPE